MNTIELLDLVWEANIQNINDIREFRISNSCEMKLYRLEMETYSRQSKFGEDCKDSEIWMICSGGDDMVDKLKIQKISKEFNLSAKGGVAVLLFQGNSKSLDELKDEKVSFLILSQASWIFGFQTYYIAEQELRNLFSNSQKKFVDDPLYYLQPIFKDQDFCNIVNIKHLNANSIIDLLGDVLQRDKEMNWDPFGY
ncbi:hypothetical protein C2G38_2047736 [Gigaspora rosea]|uniref:Uncharacterized protein n=1 Tax=Gigaspora rosea TaxID=44941 RepID=A0A397U859_9GLOM|nr:hypothetical protein C2G38_2047736 [Gigaspora rosea]